MKKYFLGEAANYSGRAIFRHVFAFATPSASRRLTATLAERFAVSPSGVALTMNGRSALYLALKSLAPKGSKVIINGFTCQAVVEAVIKAGCTPLYADIDESSLHFNLGTLKSAMKGHKNVRAIIVQHTLGLPVDDKIFAYARKNHLAVIEDFAHSVPAELKGDAAALSFGKGKAIDTITGGALVSKTSVNQPHRRQSFAATFRARFYPLFGRTARALYPHYAHKIFLGALLKLHFIERSADAPVAPHCRLAHWQAKLVLRQLEAPSTGRSSSTARTPNTRSAKTAPLPCPRTHLLVKNREAALESLARAGYFFDEIWYDVPISPRRNYQRWHFPEKDCPTAVKVSQHIINLPTYYDKTTTKTAVKLIKESQK